MVRIAEALEVYDFPRAEEANRVIYVRVVRQPEDVVVSRARLLFRREVFRQVGDEVALDLHRRRAPRESRRRSRVYARGVVYEVRVKSGLLDLVFRQVPRQLVHDSTYHFQVSQFARASTLDGNLRDFRVQINCEIIRSAPAVGNLFSVNDFFQDLF